VGSDDDDDDDHSIAVGTLSTSYLDMITKLMIRKVKKEGRE
jgi:hypothetical protein